MTSGWLVRLAAVLTEVTVDTAALARRVERDWRDADGVERVTRLHLLHRALAAEAHAVAALTALITDRDPADAPLGTPLDRAAPVLRPSIATGRAGTGLRLAGTAADQVSDDPDGMRLPGTS